uniref:C-type lectin domain-containing protein n=1 Tax=Globodera pallida TaxID=36090 RepID=A0A183CF29_GLOPA
MCNSFVRHMCNCRTGTNGLTPPASASPFNLNNPSVSVCIGFGWTISSGNCYKVVEGLMDWNQAVAACRAEDPAAALVSINSEAENRLIGRMIARSISRSLQTYRLATTLFNTLWIGLRRVRAGGQYQSTWPNGTLATFGNVPEITTAESTTGGRNIYPWGSGQPSGTNKYTDPTGTNEECVHMFSADGQWNDVGCEIQMTGAICQKSAQF